MQAKNYILLMIQKNHPISSHTLAGYDTQNMIYLFRKEIIEQEKQNEQK